MNVPALVMLGGWVGWMWVQARSKEEAQAPTSFESFRAQDQDVKGRCCG